jgi:hypothetical protein
LGGGRKREKKRGTLPDFGGKRKAKKKKHIARFVY